MALIADQINVGPVEPLPVVKSDLQKLRESFAGPSDVKVINNPVYKIGVIDPFAVKKKRSVEELLLINEVRKQNSSSDQGDNVSVEDIFTLQQIREIARLRLELEQLNEYRASLNLPTPHLPPDWTIDREVDGSFNRLRAKLDGVDLNDTYDKETPIFIVDRQVAIDFDNIRKNFLVGNDNNKIISIEDADQYYADKKSKEHEEREAAIAAYLERLHAEHEAEVLRLARIKLDKSQQLSQQASERDKELQQLIEDKKRIELELQRASLDQKQKVADDKAAAAKVLEDLVLSKVSGPQRPHMIKKIKSAATSLIEYKSSAFNSDMLSSSKD